MREAVGERIEGHLFADSRGTKLFHHVLRQGSLEMAVEMDLPIPLPENVSLQEIHAHLMHRFNVLIIFEDELMAALESFVRREIVSGQNEQADGLLRAYFNRQIESDASGGRVFGTISKGEAPLSGGRFGETFRHLVKNASPETLAKLLALEARMADEMSALVRARDWDMERVKRDCENALADDRDVDSHPAQLARLNDKMRQIHTSYAFQLEDLASRQRREYRSVIESLYETDELPSELDSDALQSPMYDGRSLLQSVSSTVGNELNESFTVYLGAQLKTMHNARLVSASRLTDVCRPFGGVELSSRMQSSMSLYARSLSAVVLLVPRSTHSHVHTRTDFARLCEQSTELHFDSLSKQLDDLKIAVSSCSLKSLMAQVGEANAVRAAMEESKVDEEKAERFTDRPVVEDDSTLTPGDVYITKHSNLPGVHVVFHLVVDKSLETDEITSRHSCFTGLRNIIRLAGRFGITSISLPLLLVEQANEVSSTGSGSTFVAGSSTSHSPHYNLQFVLPSGLVPSVYSQIVHMFPTIFHLVPSVSA